MRSRLHVRGYADRPGARAGESLSFHVNLNDEGSYRTQLVRLLNGDVNPDGPGPQVEELDSEVNGVRPGGPRRTQSGSFVRVADADGALAGTTGFTLRVFVWATAPSAGRQGLVSRWDEERSAGWALTLVEGALSFSVGDGSTVTTATSSKPLFVETWYAVVVSYTPEDGRITLSQRPLVNRTSSRFGPVVPYDGVAVASSHHSGAPGQPDVDLLLAGLAESADSPWVTAPYSGKLDSPSIWGRALDEAEVQRALTGADVATADLVADWSLGQDGTPGPGLGDRVVEQIAGRHGVCVNQPDRAMTGWSWTSDEDKFVHAPEQYGALWFHPESIDDCRWPESFRYTVPDDLPSGCYAMRLSTHVGEGTADAVANQEFFVPFFVASTPENQSSSILFLVPTFSYLAYANSQTGQYASEGQLSNGTITVLEDFDFALNEGVGEFGLSLYDQHADGRGVMYATWRRPLVMMQPSYQHEFGSVWQFQADLHLVSWMRSQGIAFDVATDHDVVREGQNLLGRYQVVVTGTHPEYYSGPLIDAWEDFLAAGGRGMYLGGNGMYWVASQHPEKPHVLEIRRGEGGDQAWRGRPGELHHSTTGEKGGLWRFRGRAPQKVWGTGYTSHTMAISTYYEPLPDSRDPRIAWMMEGLEDDDRIGDFGLVHGGAAGLEIDRYDVTQGTPPHTLILASSVGHDASAMLVPEELMFAHPAGNGEESPLVRADITYFTTPGGGAMFASSSMSWCGSLHHNHGQNNVSRLTSNVLRRFAEPAPIDEVL